MWAIMMMLVVLPHLQEQKKEAISHIDHEVVSLVSQLGKMPPSRLIATTDGQTKSEDWRVPLPRQRSGRMKEKVKQKKFPFVTLCIEKERGHIFAKSIIVQCGSQCWKINKMFFFLRLEITQGEY